MNIPSSPIGSNTNAGTEIIGADSKKQVLGKDDFLQLLVAQMQAQDPLDPMDNTEFSSQLAQFSALEQMQNVNTNLLNLIDTQETSNMNMLTNMIDKVVTSPGNGITISEGKVDPIIYELGSTAGTVTIDIFDSNNNKVSTINQGTKTGGRHEFEWDGKNTGGKTLSDGNYSYSIRALDSEEMPVASIAYQKTRVTGVEFIDGKSFLIAGGNKIDVSLVTSVSSS